MPGWDDFQTGDKDWGDPGFQAAMEGDQPPTEGESAMSNAIAGVGTLFQRENDGSSGNYTTISEIVSIGGPSMTRNAIDTTSLDTIGGFKTFIMGLREGGEVQLEMNYTTDGYAQMLDDYNNDDSVNYQIILPDTGQTLLGFAGYVMTLPLTIRADDKITMQVTIKISGEVTRES